MTDACCMECGLRGVGVTLYPEWRYNPLAKCQSRGLFCAEHRTPPVWRFADRWARRTATVEENRQITNYRGAKGI